MIDLSIHPTEIAINKSTKVTLRLTNTGVGTCTNVCLTFRFPRQILLVRGKKRLEIARLRKGESYEHDLHLKARETGEFQFSSSNFSYRDSFGQSVRPPQTKRSLHVVKPPPPPPPKPKPDPTSESTRSLKLDLERGLNALKIRLQSGDGNIYLRFTTLESRLLQNMQDERDFGPDSSLRSDRARIIRELNRLALTHLGRSFNDLC